ncbi:MAG: hypothetical protein HUJ94_07045 [Bacteroidales bacterium]|nr:hypothetical protein [Bacteroidales bacterium]
MKRLGLVNRLRIYITGAVTVLFSVAMFLVNASSRKAVLDTEMANEKIDLAHTAELLCILSERGMDPDELEICAEATGAD